MAVRKNVEFRKTERNPDLSGNHNGGDKLKMVSSVRLTLRQAQCERNMVTARMNMSFWVYILKCADGTFYTGHTENLEKRIAEHQQKLLNCYTTSRLPVELVFCSEFATRLEALASERQIKGWTRNKKKALINSDWKALVRYSKNNQ